MRKRILSAGAFQTDRQRLLGKPLSKRQADVLQLLATGMQDKVIARRLGISEGTLRAHKMAVYRKLGVSNRTQAALALANVEWLR